MSGRLLRDETGSISSSESSFSAITSSFTQRLQQWAQPSLRDVADDYHVTVWLGDLNYRCESKMVISKLSCTHVASLNMVHNA